MNKSVDAGTSVVFPHLNNSPLTHTPLKKHKVMTTFKQTYKIRVVPMILDQKTKTSEDVGLVFVLTVLSQ